MILEGLHMTKEWVAICKDCQKEFGYSEASYKLGKRRGLSRPERCPNCRRLHSREISTLGLSHYEMTPIMAIPETGLTSGQLGGLIRSKRVHLEKEIKSTFNFDLFGIKDEHIREFFSLLTKHQVAVVVAPTGAGKSTFLPYRLMVPPDPYPKDLFSRNGQIIVTQPRIQATRNIPAFVAKDLNGSSLGAGFDVGYRHSGDPATDWRNKLVYMTDGSLINIIIRNELHKVSVIMIDEAHERSLNIDLILGLLKKHLPKYPHLKVIIASATIDTDLFVNFFGGPEKVVKYSFTGKRQFPVETRYFAGEPIPFSQMPARMPDEVAKKAFDILLSMVADVNPEISTMEVEDRKTRVKGDILVFLHGEKPIERAAATLREMIDDESRLVGKVEVLPLYAKLPQASQDKALKQKKTQRKYHVVISTNVAETSLTVPGIVHVVDTGLINESQWDLVTQTIFVVPKQHSQAGCIQRWGRAGRIQPGIAHCLYTEDQFGGFQKNTDPEIIRAPIDQVILTAKAAGVDDVQKFDWIQRPKENELVRSPDYLQRIGALDEEGDLTEHGLELRYFSENIDVANLMILADRFGCAVEMAILIPMIKLGGGSKMLMWNRGWDAPTKRAVHRIHEGLRSPCQDDIEFCLKLWALWEGDFSNGEGKNSENWAHRLFVNHNVMENIEKERNALLFSLSGHRKEQTYRSVALELITRIRMLMVYGLGTQIYHHKHCSDDSDTEDPVYKPYIKNPETSPELLALHQDAVVQINPDSICFGHLPEWFVCGERKRLLIRKSPLLEPETTITASFIGLIKPEWIDLIGKPPIIVAHMIAEETRKADGLLNQKNNFEHLFLDQIFPVGAMYKCALKEGGMVDIGELLLNAPNIKTRLSNEDIETDDIFECMEEEGVLDRDVGLEENSAAVVLETEDIVNLTEIFDTEEDENQIDTSLGAFNRQRKINERYIGKLKYSKDELPLFAVFTGIVIGYDFSNRTLPQVDIRVPITPDPFEQFVEKYEVWQDVQVTVVGLEKYFGDWMNYLVVREVETGLEIVMDPYDISLIGRNFAVDALCEIGPEIPITVTIEDIDLNNKIVRLTRLKKSQEALRNFIKEEKKRTVDASIVDVRENGLYLWLDPVNTYEYSPCSVFVHFKQLIQRPEEMSLGQSCRVLISKRDFDKPLRRSIVIDDPDLFDLLEKMNLPAGVKWDSFTQVLSINKQMTFDQRKSLLGVSGNYAFQRAVNWLFRRSNQFYARILDISGAVEMAEYVGTKNIVPAKVVRLQYFGIFVEMENGAEALIHKSELDYKPDPRELSERFEIGQNVDMYIKNVDLDDGKVAGSLLNPDQDPWLKFSSGQIVDGVVVKVLNYGVLVEIVPGAIGKVPIEKASWGYVEDIKTEFQVGQTVTVLIESIDLEERQAELSLQIADNDPLRKYKIGQIVNGTVIGFLDNEKGAFIELEKYAEGFLHISEVSINRISGVREILKDAQNVVVRITDLDYEERKCYLTMKGIYWEELFIPSTHVGLLIGSGGRTIRKIQNDTKTFIEIDGDSGMCRIEAPNKEAVRAGVVSVQKILETQVVYCVLSKQLIPILIGSGGSTVKRIQKQTGAQINIEGNSGKVTIIAGDKKILKQVVNEINNVIGSFEATIQVPQKIAHYVIGRGGETVKTIRARSNVQRIDLEKDVYQKFTGKVTIIGAKPQDVNLAIRLINQQVGSSTLLLSRQISLPPLSPVTSDMPKSKPAHKKSKSQEFAYRQTASNPKIVSSQTSNANKKVLKQEIFQQKYRLTMTQAQKFIRKPGGLLSVLFGGGLSPMERIRQRSGARISINSDNIVKIVTSSQERLERTIKIFEEEMRCKVT